MLGPACSWAAGTDVRRALPVRGTGWVDPLDEPPRRRCRARVDRPHPHREPVSAQHVRYAERLVTALGIDAARLVAHHL
ncbi:MAG: hypothetical protein ACRDRH_14015 [Pseudonocardia sp.]